MTKSSLLKFDILLAQYLYQHKKLNLPGIGTFEADSTVIAPDENDKQKPSYEGISFKNTNVTQADDDLIEFIKVHTGKMKPLAISDLESYLTLGKQFLFIGKPFYLEGIGTLSLTKEGQFIFTPGEFVTTKLEDPNVERSEGKRRSVYEEDRLQQESKTNAFKITLLAIGLIALIGLIGYGGYYVYTMYTNQQPAPVLNNSTNLTDTTPIGSSSDSLLINPSTDSLAAQTQLLPVNNFKFVVEITSDKQRALNRYRDLRSIGNKIQFETIDSNRFKLYYLLPATVSDTLRIRDSLNNWYYPGSSTTRVRIE